MDPPTYNICQLFLKREINGQFILKKFKKTNLIRSDVDQLRVEEHTHWPVSVWRYNKLFICVLFYFDNHEEFLEDLHFCSHDFDAVIGEYLFTSPITYV